MAALVRALQVPDFLPYLAFTKRVNRQDGVVTLAGPGRTTPWRQLLLQGLLLDPARPRWICRDGNQIVASLGVRARPGVDVWEVDECAGLPTPAGRLGRLRLLNHITEEATEEGIQKIFMRVPESGTLEELARQAGFVTYAVERIYVRPPAPAAPVLPPAGLRARRGADHHALFRLYSTVVPGRVRQVEAMTLHEWRFIDGWHAARMRWATGFDLMRRDVVVERDGQIVAWLQLNRRRSLLRCLTHPDFASDLPQLIAWGVSTLHAPTGHVCALRTYQVDAEPAVLAAGFHLGAEHALLAQLLAVRVHEPKLVPVRV